MWGAEILDESRRKCDQIKGPDWTVALEWTAWWRFGLGVAVGLAIRAGRLGSGDGVA